jgi:Holliday junction resolvasome RuvABC endonuclease subunit
LGLDISSVRTGWAIIKNGRFYKRLGKDYGTIVPKPSFCPGEKISFFRKELLAVIKEVGPDLVGIEDVFFYRNINTLKVLSRFSGVALELIYSVLKKEPIYIQVKEIRATFGTQDKNDIFKTMIDKYKIDNWSFDTHNDVADALVIASHIYTSTKRENK